MIKKIIILSMFVVFNFSLFADSSYDRTIEVLDSSREEKVKQVFRELIGAYQDEDARQFFEFVSEDRFLQDYVTFTDGIYQDFRYYDILEVDYYFDQVVPKGIKRFLYVRWEKRYETLDTAKQYTQTGYSRFLFDEVDGKYLLIELAGNNLWAESVEEWTDEVPVIPGQEVRTSSSTKILDLSLTKNSSPFSISEIYVDINNVGEVDVNIGSINYEVSSPDIVSPTPVLGMGNISISKILVGESATSLGMILPAAYAGATSGTRFIYKIIFSDNSISNNQFIFIKP